MKFEDLHKINNGLGDPPEKNYSQIFLFFLTKQGEKIDFKNVNPPPQKQIAP